MYEIKYFPNYGQMNLVNILVILFLYNKAIAFFKALRVILTLDILLGFKTFLFSIDWGKVVLLSAIKNKASKYGCVKLRVIRKKNQ